MREIETVQKIQDYIRIHHKDANFNINDICSKIGYSRRQVDRIFKKYLNKTLQEYVSAVCLTDSANELLNTKKTILEVALNSHYKTHEGFSRSFYKKFHINPSVYREKRLLFHYSYNIRLVTIMLCLKIRRNYLWVMI